MAIDFVGFAYAITVAAGGVMGYVKAQSVPSLAAGLVFGALLGYGSYLISQDMHNYALSLGVSTFLVGLMGFRCYASGKFIPSGFIAILSLLNVFRLSSRFALMIEETETETETERLE